MTLRFAFFFFKLFYDFHHQYKIFLYIYMCVHYEIRTEATSVGIRWLPFNDVNLLSNVLWIESLCCLGKFYRMDKNVFSLYVLKD